jgi:hypothetical protein
MKRQALFPIVLFVTVFGLFLALRRHPGAVGPKPVDDERCRSASSTQRSAGDRNPFDI